jgi:hypothetical protein
MGTVRPRESRSESDEREFGMATKKSSEKALAVPTIDDDLLRGIVSLEDAMRVAAELYGGPAVDASELLGNGFRLVEDKNTLVGKPLFVLATKMHAGDYGEFVTVFAVTMEHPNERVMFNDGSTGVYYDVKQLTAATGVPGGWIIKRGLSLSEYSTCIGCSRPRNARVEICEVCSDESTERKKGATFYLDAA